MLVIAMQMTTRAVKAQAAAKSDEGQIYGVDGAQRTTLSRGLNIMRSKEGTRKILCN